MNFKITIEEHVTETFEVEANSIEEAMDITRNKYKNGEFVLENGNVTYRCMAVQEPMTTEWMGF